MRRLVPLALVIALVSLACGDDDTAPADPALVAGLRQRISENQQDSGGPEMSDAEIECFAIGIIDLFGADRITAGIDMEFSAFMGTATQEERRSVVDTMFECVDLALDLAEELGAGGEVSAESARCLADVMLANDAFRDATAEAFVSSTDPFDDPELVAELLPPMLECMIAEELGDLGNG